MFNNDIKISFYPAKQEYLEYIDPPYPAKQHTPQWLNNTPLYYTGDRQIDNRNEPTSTIKKCMPVLDSIGAGYHISLPCDVWVEIQEDEECEEQIYIKWALKHLNLVQTHKYEQVKNYPLEDEYDCTPFKWINPWIIKTPKNWSCLFIQPLHQDSVPFKCLSSIVDTDKHPIPINIPFFLRKGFEGLIPKGTPIMQVIPIKRQKCTAEIKNENPKFVSEWYRAASSFFDIYAKHFRSPKKYEMSDSKVSKCPFSKN